MRINKRLTGGLLALLALWSTTGLAGTTHYRWLNDRNEPVYSDRPPPKGVNYEVISTTSTFKRTVSGEEGAVPLDTNPSVGNEFEQIDTAQRSKNNPELCERAKANLEALTTSDQVKVRNDQGEIRLLSLEEMEVERQTAKAQASVYCD